MLSKEDWPYDVFTTLEYVSHFSLHVSQDHNYFGIRIFWDILWSSARSFHKYTRRFVKRIFVYAYHEEDSVYTILFSMFRFEFCWLSSYCYFVISISNNIDFLFWRENEFWQGEKKSALTESRLILVIEHKRQYSILSNKQICIFAKIRV